MRKIMIRVLLIILFTLGSDFAFSTCPNLSGNFSCREGEKVWSETIVTSLVHGTYRYNFVTMGESVVFIADGKTRSQDLGESSPLYDFVYTATCDKAGHLLVEMEAKSISNGADIFVKNEFSLDDGSNLILNFSGNFGNYSDPETIRVCTRK